MAFRSYEASDHEALLYLINGLQSYIASLDHLHRQKSGNDFDAENYVARMLQKVSDNEGEIFIAETDKEVVGCIVGYIPRPSKEDLLESYPAKEGVILELIVSEQMRGSGIGSELMKAMEEYFREKGCVFVRVTCFAPNIDAHTFYQKHGYGERSIDMLKKL